MRPYINGQDFTHLIKTAIPDFAESEYPVFVEFVTAFIRFLEEERTTSPRTITSVYGPGETLLTGTVSNTTPTTLTGTGTLFTSELVAGQSILLGGNTTVIIRSTENSIANDTFLTLETAPTTAVSNVSIASVETANTTTVYGGPLYEARRLMEYRDSATTLDEFKTQFVGMFAKNYPQYTHISTDWFVRSLHDFYQNKGTEDSIRWFFRVFFNTDAELYYPRTDILTTSDATWSEPASIKVKLSDAGYVDADVATYYAKQTIKSSTAVAEVERVVSTLVGPEKLPVHELYLRYGSLRGTFEPGQTLLNVDVTQEIETTILSGISSVTVGASGTEYDIGDLVTFSEGVGGGGGYDAAGHVSAITSGSIAGISVTDAGGGFLINEPVLFSTGSGSGASGYISALDNADDSLYLDLTIEAFCNATATVTMGTADYGDSTGVAAFDGKDLDVLVSYVFDSANAKDFYTPWVWTDSAHTTAELANLSMLVVDTSTQPFVSVNTAVDEGHTGKIFVVGGGVYDTAENANTCETCASPVGYFTVGLAGNAVSDSGTTQLYLKTVANQAILLLKTGEVVKQDYTNTQIGTVTTTAACTVVTGVGTTFTEALTEGTHLRFPSTSEDVVVFTIANDTEFTTHTPVATAIAANTFATYPTATIKTMVERGIVNYGSINAVALTSAGTGYKVPPTPSVSAMDARVQALWYYDADADVSTGTSTAGTAAPLFVPATLTAVQGAGQIKTVVMDNSGVGYTDANAITTTATHGSTASTDALAATLLPVLGAKTQYAGLFTTNRSFLSSNKYLQDADFYNNHTYVVKAAESFERYRGLLMKLLHPLGTRAYGWFSIVDAVQLNLSAIDSAIEAISLPVVVKTYAYDASAHLGDTLPWILGIISPSASASSTASPSVSASISPSASASLSRSPSASRSPSTSVSASLSPSTSISPSASL